MRHGIRAGALALALVAAATASGFTYGQPSAEPSLDGPAAVPELVAGVAHDIDARRHLLDRQRRQKQATREQQRPHHPVAGAVGYGEAGARFGAGRGGRAHEGQDVFAPAGTPLLAVGDGEVVETGNDGGRGNYIAIHSASADETYVYLHMQAPTPLAVGRRVDAGDRVGALGCTGSCFGDHLHFEIRAGRGTTGAARDPLPLLLSWGRPR